MLLPEVTAPFALPWSLFCIFAPIQAILAVDACLAVKDGLLAASATAGSTPRVLLAVDDYNMLHWRTEYGRTTEEGARQLLVPDDLTLVGGGKQTMACAQLHSGDVATCVTGHAAAGGLPMDERSLPCLRCCWHPAAFAGFAHAPAG